MHRVGDARNAAVHWVDRETLAYTADYFFQAAWARSQSGARPTLKPFTL